MKEEMLINECSPTGFNIKESFKEYLIEKSKVIVEVLEDTMYPTIRNGSAVLGYLLKKENWNDAESGRIYVVVFKEVPMIGRLTENSILDKNMIVLHPDNKNYPPITILAEDIEAMLLVDRIVSQDVF
jgi:phage repressor protein C with HTH and peptisase S24 domain